MKKLLFLPILLVLVAVYTSCEKDPDTPQNPTSPAESVPSFDYREWTGKYSVRHYFEIWNGTEYETRYNDDTLTLTLVEGCDSVLHSCLALYEYPECDLTCHADGTFNWSLHDSRAVLAVHGRFYGLDSIYIVEEYQWSLGTAPIEWHGVRIAD